MRRGNQSCFQEIYRFSHLPLFNCQQLAFWEPNDPEALPTLFRPAYGRLDRSMPGLAVHLGLLPNGQAQQLHDGLWDVYTRCSKRYLKTSPPAGAMVVQLQPLVYAIGSPLS